VTIALPVATGHRFWLAYQDGDGPWKLAPSGNTTHTLQIENTLGRYSLVLVDEPLAPNTSESVSVRSFHLTREESSSINFARTYSGGQQTTSVSISYLGATPQSVCQVAIGVNHISDGNGCNDFMMGQIPLGKTDVIATQADGNGLTNRVAVGRDIEITPGTRLNVNLSSSLPLTPPKSLPIAGAPMVSGEYRSLYAVWVSGKSLAMLSNNQSTMAYPTIAAGAQSSNDHYSVYAGYLLDQGGVTRVRGATFQSKSGEPKTLSIPEQAKPINFGFLPGPGGPRPTAAWTPAAGSAMSYMTVIGWTSNPSPVWEFSFSSGWLQNTTTASFTFPDLSSLGWSTKWNLPSGSSATMYYEETGISAPYPGFFTRTGSDQFTENMQWNTGVATNISIPSTAAPQATDHPRPQAIPSSSGVFQARRLPFRLPSGVPIQALMPQRHNQIQH
jgi:hypothetical protein